MFRGKLFHKNLFVVLVADCILLAVSLYAAHLFRFEFIVPPKKAELFWLIIVMVLAVKIISFFFFDLYSGMWRYTGISDLLNIIKASTLSSLVIIFFILFSPRRFMGFSRSVFLIDWGFTILLVSGFRLCIRLYFERIGRDEPWPPSRRQFVKVFSSKDAKRQKLLIIGAGDCGVKVHKEVMENQKLGFQVVGYLDDDPLKLGKRIHGVPVLGRVEDLKAAAKKSKAEEAIIAFPSASAREIRRVVFLCTDSGIKYRIVPAIGELINGSTTVNSAREVDYLDLLGREIVRLDQQKIGDYIAGRTVLVTGAGGSIGSELCRQICRFRPRSLVLYERAESPLHELQLELESMFKGVQIQPVLADIADRSQVEKAFTLFGPQAVFHAAAYKHVPMLELQPWKAVENNILGTLTLIEAIRAYAVERFVLVSTDKAVRPANVMGASKRIAEMIVENENACGVSATRFMVVRFGNVIGSIGSVVPLFKKQIAKGGPVTVTHRDMTRYFMSIPEACQLILQAGGMGQGGEIFLLDMGRPINIAEMARELIKLSGLEPDVDIEVEYIGLRPGEKLHEQLMTEDETLVLTGHEKILALRGKECDSVILNGKIAELAQLALKQDREGIQAKLREMLPEYNPFVLGDS